MVGVQTLEAETPEERSRAFDDLWNQPTGRWKFFQQVNNIPIAQRYMGTAFAMFLVGGVLALLIRAQLIVPENKLVGAEAFNQLFTMHGTTMMFLFVIPFLEAIGTYFLPLLLGTRDLPFPRLTAFAYWTYAFGVVYIYSSFLFGVAPDGGWFAYPPLTLKEYSPGLNIDFWDIGLSVAEIAALGAAAEIIVAVLRMRVPGMGLSRLPIFAWSMLVFAVMIIFAFTPLIVGTAFLELDRKGVTFFFDPEHGGKPLLWQHIFWVFGHPEVYIMFIPAAGIATHIVQTFSRRSIVSYPLIVLSILAIAFLSFGLWVHHMFSTGLPTTALGFFAAASLVIAIPNGVQFFSWLATIWTGKPVWSTPMLFTIGFLIIFLLGGLTGVMVGVVPFDWQVHDSYFVVAHFHYVLIGGVLFPLFAGMYYWLPKMTGRMLSERLGKIQFWLMFVFFNVAFFPMHITGLHGMPRRVYTYEADLGWNGLNLISSIGAFGFALGVVLGLVNFFWSLRYGKQAGPNPWNGDSLEWSHSSPPPNAQFKYIPEVRGRHPMWDQDSLEPTDARFAKLVEPLQSAPTTWRGALVVSVREGAPTGIVHVAGPTAWPFLEAVAFLILFAGLLIERMVVIAPGVILAIVALIGWFWPKPSEANALAEIDIEGSEDRLPLFVYGRRSNGWWGTCVFVAIWSTAFFTSVASYFYLGEGPSGYWPPSVPNLIFGLLATAAALASIPTVHMFARTVPNGSPSMRRTGLALTALLHIILLGFAVLSLTTSDVRMETAYGSSVAFLIGFQCVTAAILLAMLAGSFAWTWFKPADPRGWGFACNTSLVGYYAAANWLITFVVISITPLLW